MSRHVNTSDEHGSGKHGRAPWHALGGGGVAVLLGALLPWLSFSAAGVRPTARDQVVIVALSVALIAAGIAPRPVFRRPSRLTASGIALALTALAGLYCALA